MSGLPLYLTYGFERIEDQELTMPDGVTVTCVSMRKPVA